MMGTQGPAAPGGIAHLKVLRDILEGADRAALACRAQDFTRSGPLSLPLMVALLLFLVADSGRRGYALLLEAFWGAAKGARLELPRREPVSAAAFCLARQKLRAEGIRELVWRSAERFEHEWGEGFRWRGRRLFAVDGSRVDLQRAEGLWQRYGAATGGGWPQATLSTLFDLVSKVPHDVCVAPFGADERGLLLEEHLDRLCRGDLLVLDRGYPSYSVLRELLARGVDFAVRVPTRSGFPAVARFVDSGKRNAQIEIAVPWGYGCRDAAPLSVRAVRLPGPDAEPMVVLTSLPLRGFGWRVIRELYRMRWGIESYYDVVKGDYFGQRQFHAKSPVGVEQEIYAQALLVSLTRHLMAAAAKRQGVPYEHLGDKRAILAVAEALTRLLLTRRPRDAHALLNDILRRIARRPVPPRPDRSYERRSFKPGSKWHAHGRRGRPRLA